MKERFIVAFLFLAVLLIRIPLMGCSFNNEANSPINTKARMEGEKISKAATAKIINEGGIVVKEVVDYGNQKIANDVVSEMIFIKEPRTNLCFVYLWHGNGYGGPALTEIPCEAVPTDMLYVGVIANK